MGAAAAAQMIPLGFTTGMSAIEMVQSRKSAEAGREKFKEGIKKTKNLLEQNVQEELNVNDEATRLKGQQNLAALQQLTDATSGAGQRAVLGATGGLMTAADAANEAERGTLQKRLEAREKAILDQDEVNRQGKMSLELDLASVGKAEQMEARKNQQAFMGQLVKGAGGLAKAGIFVDSLGEDQLGGLSRSQAKDAVMDANYDRRTINNARRGGFVPDEDLFSNYRSNLTGANPLLQTTGVLTNDVYNEIRGNESMQQANNYFPSWLKG